MDVKDLWELLKREYPKRHPFEAMAGVFPSGTTYNVEKGELDDGTVFYVTTETATFMREFSDVTIFEGAVLPLAHLLKGAYTRDG